MILQQGSNSLGHMYLDFVLSWKQGRELSYLKVLHCGMSEDIPRFLWTRHPLICLGWVPIGAIVPGKLLMESPFTFQSFGERFVSLSTVNECLG